MSTIEVNQHPRNTATWDVVATTELERDERVDQLQKLLRGTLVQERGYQELARENKERVDSVLNSLATMRFDSRRALEEISVNLLAAVAPGLAKYVPIALDNASRELRGTRGVLVIYAGGTIGSAPKDPDDPDSPQIVKPWRELKNASPQLGLLGYPVDAISFVEPLDSCNVGPKHWRTIVKLIEKYYNDYEGFVILHGTDSMVYTASALSFMLYDLAKPVVMTGSQVAGIVNPRNDAHQNMITAIMLANPRAHNLPPIPEVVVAFGNIFSRGNRCKKMNVVGYQGFWSPNYPRLGEAGEFITLERKHLRPVPRTDLQTYENLDTNVIMLEVFPGMQHSPILGNILKDDRLRGVVLKSYGAGNIPTDPGFLNLFKKFIDRGGVVVNVTSVPQGEVVMGLYETSQVLIDRGLIGGFDLTPEAAMCKLMMLLGTYGDDVATVKKLMQKSIAGEQTLNLDTTSFSGSFRLSAGKAESLPKAELASVEDEARINRVMLRFKNAQIAPGGEGARVTIKISLEDGTVLAQYRRGRVPEHALVKDDTVGESLAFDLTVHKEKFVSKVSDRPRGLLQSTQRISFKVALEAAEGATFAWTDAELNIYSIE